MNTLKVSFNKSLILAVGCMLCVAASSRADIPKVKIVPLKSMKGVNLFIETPHGTSCTLQIQDEAGTFLWKEVTTVENYGKSIDLSGLPSATYRVIATNEEGRLTTAFVVKDNRIEILEEKTKAVRYPEIAVMRRGVMIDATKAAGESLNVSIFDNKGDLIYRNQFFDLSEVIKLNLKYLFAGTYKLYFDMAGFSAIKTMEIKG